MPLYHFANIIVALPCGSQSKEACFGGNCGSGCSGRRSEEEKQTEEAWHDCVHEMVLIVFSSETLRKKVSSSKKCVVQGNQRTVNMGTPIEVFFNLVFPNEALSLPWFGPL